MAIDELTASLNREAIELRAQNKLMRAALRVIAFGKTEADLGDAIAIKRLVDVATEALSGSPPQPEGNQ